MKKEMTVQQLLNLLRGKSITPDVEERVIAHRIECMSEKDVKKAVIDFLYLG